MLVIKKIQFIASYTSVSGCPKNNLPEYAFVGRSNVGKSTLINLLTNRKHLAKTSSIPGKTRLINYFIINDTFYLVDLPGYGYAKVSKAKKKGFDKTLTNYILKRKNLTCLFVLIDSRHSLFDNDRLFMQWLGENKIPFVIVFTKIDKLSSSNLHKNARNFKNEMLKDWEYLPRIFETSAKTGVGRDEILTYIESVNKEITS